MFTKNTSKSVLTLTVVTVTTLALTAGTTQAAVTLIGTPDFTLSSSTSSGTVHDNPPAAFDSQIAPGDITPSASSTLGSFPESNLTDGDLTTGSGTSAWASGTAASVTVTLDFASANVSGIILNWGWGDRTPGDYEIKVDGTSLGSINVDTAGGTSAAESTEPNTYIIFDAVQTGATKIEVIGTNGGGNANAWGFDEIEVYNGVVVPAPAALPAGLAMLAIAAMRRRRK